MFYKKDNLVHSPISKETELLIEEIEQFNKDNYEKYLDRKDDDEQGMCVLV